MYNNSINYSFRHSKIALLTKHQKDQVISPLLWNYLGSVVELVTGYDTDNLGTFTREIQRSQSQLETARIKAHKAIEISGLELGIGSEGSFSSDPYVGLMPWNTEMVVLVDIRNGIEIVGVEQRPFKNVQKKVNSLKELDEILIAVDFPKNNLVLRPDDENSPSIYKDFTNAADLKKKFMDLLKTSASGTVFVENDHRAHRSIERMEAIKYATIDLIIKCHSFCPECSSPGFWINRREGGLPCTYCGVVSDTFKYLVYQCNRCLYEKRLLRKDLSEIDPQFCNVCNP